MNCMENLGNCFLFPHCNHCMVVIRHNSVGRQKKFISFFVVFQLVNDDLGKYGIVESALPFMGNAGYKIGSARINRTETDHIQISWDGLPRP